MIDGLVSTIIPVYNRPAQLREAVQSVLAQDYRPIEVIIVDDGSTDDIRLRWRRRWRAQHPDIVRAVTQANAGPGLAREHGRQLAQGEFIQYLDSDDVLLPGKFSAQVAALRDAPEAGVAYGMTRYFRHRMAFAPGPHKGSRRARDRCDVSGVPGRAAGGKRPTRCIAPSVRHEQGHGPTCAWKRTGNTTAALQRMGTRLVYCPTAVSEHRDHEGGRLSRGEQRDPRRNAMRARSHELIFGHAMRAGLAGTPEMQHFARALFLLARQCGASGLAEQSRRLFALAQQASGDAARAQADFRMYGLAAKLYKMDASILGWVAMGRLSSWLDKARG